MYHRNIGNRVLIPCDKIGDERYTHVWNMFKEKIQLPRKIFIDTRSTSEKVKKAMAIASLMISHLTQLALKLCINFFPIWRWNQHRLCVILFEKLQNLLSA